MRTWIVLCLVSCAVAGYCAPSGLNMIPTADVLEAGHLSVEGYVSGKPRTLVNSADVSHFIQVGLGWGIEIGCDTFDGDENTSLWNAKFSREVGKGSAIAIGVQDCGGDCRSHLYGMGYVPIGSGRIHGGLIGLDQGARFMLGYDRALSSKFTLQADYTSGPENTSSLGGSLALPMNLAATAGVTRSNSGRGRWSCFAVLGWYP